MASKPSESVDETKNSDELLKSRRLTLRNIAQMIVFALAIKPFMALFIGLRVRGREHLSGSEPFVLIANHSSHLDTISLLSLFPLNRLRRIRPVAAADYFERNRFVSLFTKTVFNILPIARKNITTENNPLRRMREALPFFCEIRIGTPRVFTGSRQEITKALEAAVRELAPETSDSTPS